MLVGWLELTIWTLVLYTASFLSGSGRAWYRRLFRIWCRIWVHALGVELRLHQQNERPLPERYILIANHPSAFEDIGIPALFDVDSLAKTEVQHWWIVGRISVGAGTLYVHRESKESRAAAIDDLIARLHSGRNVALYPEGGVKGKRIHEQFLFGAFDVSLQTGIPIVPVFLHYEAQDDFHWSGQSLPGVLMNIMGAQNRRANYYVFDAFDPKAFDDKESYCAHVHQCFLNWQDRYLV